MQHDKNYKFQISFRKFQFFFLLPIIISGKFEKPFHHNIYQNLVQYHKPK